MRHWWWLMLGLVFFSSCVRTKRIYVQNMPGNEISGLTFCREGGPVAWINEHVIGTERERGTIEHERMHMRQIRRFPGCVQWNEWRKLHNAEVEAEAYCAQVADDVKEQRRTYDDALSMYAFWLATFYEDLQPLTPDSAKLLIRNFCPDLT